MVNMSNITLWRSTWNRNTEGLRDMIYLRLTITILTRDTGIFKDLDGPFCDRLGLHCGRLLKPRCLLPVPFSTSPTHHQGIEYGARKEKLKTTEINELLYSKVETLLWNSGLDHMLRALVELEGMVNLLKKIKQDLSFHGWNRQWSYGQKIWRLLI